MKIIYLNISLLPFLLGSAWIPYLLSVYTIVPSWLLFLSGLVAFIWIWIVYADLKNKLK